MKKYIKSSLVIVVAAIVVAGNAFATGGNGSGNEPKLKGSEVSICDYLPFLCVATTSTGGNGSGNEPKKD